MSYILEALADSEQAREQYGAAPRYSLLPVVSEEAPHVRRWPYVLAGSLLVNAVALQVWLHPPAPGGLVSIRAPASPQSVPAARLRTEPAIVPPTQSGMHGAESAATAPSVPVSQPSRPERDYNWRVARPVAVLESAPKAAPISPAMNGAKTAGRQQESKTAAKRAAAAAAMPGAGAVPAQTQAASAAASAGGAAALPPPPADLPALSVAGFIRNEGADSMVIVNDRLVREGEEVAPGVKLERILNDSLVFNYRGYRFTR